MTRILAPEEPPAAQAWLVANQRALMAEVAELRALLAGPAGSVTHENAPGGPRGEPAGVRQAPASGEPADPGEPGEPGESGEPVPSSLDAVCACFGLSAFERRIVVTCAAVELDGQFSEVLRAAHGDPGQSCPTFGLALAAFPGAHWSALAPWAPLRYWQLVELGPGPLTTAPLHIDEWLLHALAGAGGLDPRLAAIVAPLDPAGDLPPSAEHSAAVLAAAWTRPGPCVPAVLRGQARQPKRAIFAAACARLGLRPYAVSAADLPATAAERGELLRLWSRQALLEHAALLVDDDGAGEPAVRGPWERFVDRLSTPAAVACADGTVARPGRGVIIDTARPTAAEQRRLWAAALGRQASPASLDGALDRVVAQFDLDAAAIAAAAGQAMSGAPAGSGQEHDLGVHAWAACRHTARGGLDDMAQRLESTATFDDLVLPEAPRELLRDILAHVRQRSRVYGEWQMSGPSQRGLGFSALFTGPSGTGKTLAAEVLANALDLDLYRIDLSQVISKYIGETEKNLRRIFDAASQSGAVLLFDEADALFGKRSEVRDSHDRYANVEISYLLQAMESYRGLAVLTTNMRSALDQAFLRRLRFVVTFPFPGPAERAQIWMRAFPPATPTRGLDIAKLAKLSVAGGNIRAIALHAAFTAAEASVPVGMPEVLRAAAAEYAKLERPLSDTEIQGWT